MMMMRIAAGGSDTRTPSLDMNGQNGAWTTMYFDDWRIMTSVLYNVDGRNVGDTVSKLPLRGIVVFIP